MKKMNISILLGIMVVLLAATSASATWYRCTITQVSPKVDGSVAVQFLPGTNEQQFTEKSRATINPEDVGAKNILATILTAISLDKNVMISLAVAPSMDYQDINGLSLVMVY